MSAKGKATSAPSKLTPKQWAEIEALWEAGTVTLEELSKRYGKATSTFVRHFKSAGTIRGAKVDDAKRRAAEVIARGTINDAAILASRIGETKDECYKMNAAVQKLIWNEVLTSRNMGVDISTRASNIKVLKDIGAALATIRSERYALLGLDHPDAADPNELPDLIIHELSPEQIQELRDRDLTELGDLSSDPKALAGEPGDGIVDETEEESDD